MRDSRSLSSLRRHHTAASMFKTKTTGQLKKNALAHLGLDNHE